jgi:hypothetical protein
MDALAHRFLVGLERGEPDAELLRAAGDSDPAAAAQAFARAAREPALAGSLALWAPPLLASARPGFGAGCLEQMVHAGHAPDVASLPALARVLGASAFLARLLLRHPEWVGELAGSPPDAPSSAPIAPDWDAIRAAKYTGLLRIAARDLLARPFAESLRELSDLADRCLGSPAQRARPRSRRRPCSRSASSAGASSTSPPTSTCSSSTSRRRASIRSSTTTPSRA